MSATGAAAAPTGPPLTAVVLFDEDGRIRIHVHATEPDEQATAAATATAMATATAPSSYSDLIARNLRTVGHKKFPTHHERPMEGTTGEGLEFQAYMPVYAANSPWGNDLVASLELADGCFVKVTCSSGDVIYFSDRSAEERILQWLRNIKKLEAFTGAKKTRLKYSKIEKLQTRVRQYHHAIAKFLCDTFSTILLPSFQEGPRFGDWRVRRVWNHSAFRRHLIGAAQRRNVQLILTDEANHPGAPSTNH